MKPDYSSAELARAYRELKVPKGGVVYAVSDLTGLGLCAETERSKILGAHLDALRAAAGPEGTLVMPTASLALCNTETVFDPAETPSEVGILTEHFRTQTGAVRSFHPFVSYTALGPRAEELCGGVSRLDYGPETPEARMIAAGAVVLSIGIHPRFTCSTVHQVESLYKVPYRYNKEFIQPVRRGGKVVREPFYMFVWYRQCAIKREGNRRIFDAFYKDYDFKEAAVGRGRIYRYGMRDFFDCCMRLFKENIYSFLESEPAVKPYRE